LFQKIERDINPQPVLMPTMTTQGINSSQPKVRISGVMSKRLWLSCQSTNNSAVTWVIQTKSDGEWRMETFSGRQLLRTITGNLPEVIAVTEIDRTGSASKSVVFERKETFNAQHSTSNAQ